jgi:hypothetical protein
VVFVPLLSQSQLAGETATFVLDCVKPGETPVPCSDTDVAAEFDNTVAFWRGWLLSAGVNNAVLCW